MNQVIKDFVRGMGQSLDLGATAAPPKTQVRRPSEREALASHWNRVGAYLHGACDSIAQEARNNSSAQL